MPCPLPAYVLSAASQGPGKRLSKISVPQKNPTLHTAINRGSVHDKPPGPAWHQVAPDSRPLPQTLRSPWGAAAQGPEPSACNGHVPPRIALGICSLDLCSAPAPPARPRGDGRSCVRPCRGPLPSRHTHHGAHFGEGRVARTCTENTRRQALQAARELSFPQALMHRLTWTRKRWAGRCSAEKLLHVVIF